MRRQLARDVTHLFFRRDYLDVDDRLEDDRPSLGERVDECLATGGHEGDVLRINRMRLAVIDGDAHILQREAGDESGFEDVAHTLLDGRNELAGNRAALHSVDELESLAARQRFDPEKNFAELARAPCLLLV